MTLETRVTPNANDVASLFARFQSTDFGNYREIKREQLAQGTLQHWPLLAEIHACASTDAVQA